MTKVSSEPLKMQPGWSPAIPSMSLHGTRTETGEPSVSMPYGHTTCWGQPSRRLTKVELEFWQLGQFCIDLYTGTGELLAPDGVRKQEAPDFVIPRAGDSDLGVEVAAFTSKERRAHEPHVDRFRAAMAQSPSDYAHLLGCHISLSIQGTNPVPVIDRARNEILNLMRSSPRPPSVVQDLYGLSPNLTTLGSSERWDLNGYDLVPKEHVTQHDPQVPIFEIVYALERTVPEIADELHRILATHLFSGVDHLIVPVVGPDREGNAFWEDETLISAVLEHGKPLQTTFSKAKAATVLLHFWTTGKIVEIAPNRREVCHGQPDHSRRMTILTYSDGQLFCAPLSQPVLRLMARGSGAQ